MCADGADVGVWLQADTVTFNKLERKILKKLKKVNCFPGILSEFKIFVAKLMKIDANHPAIVPVYELIVGKTVSYFPCKISSPKVKKKKKTKMRLTKFEKRMKSMLEGMGICLKIPLQTDNAKASGGLQSAAPLCILENDTSDDLESSAPLFTLENYTSDDLESAAPLCILEDEDISVDLEAATPLCILEDEDISVDLEAATPLCILEDEDISVDLEAAAPLCILEDEDISVGLEAATPLCILEDEDISFDFELAAPLCILEATKKKHRTCAQRDKKWCCRERKRLLKAVKKRVGLNSPEFATDSDATGAKRKTLKSDSKKKKKILKMYSKKKDRTNGIVEVIDISGSEDNSEVGITRLDFLAPVDFEVIDITGKDDVKDIFDENNSASKNVLTQARES